jgi:sodium/potassium-transporting ATPase subunit alpha
VNNVGIQKLSVAEALESVHSRVEGLSFAEAERRLLEFGPNAMPKVQRLHPALRLLGELFRFFSIILWLAAGLAFLGAWYDPGAGMAHIGFALVGVILISGLFSFWQENRIERTLDELQKLLPQTARVLRDDCACELPVELIVVGDVVLLEQGDSIPADCRLIEQFRLRVDTSTVTGEPTARLLDAAISPEHTLLRARNVVLAGASIVSGHCTAVVFATGARTEWGKIAHIVQSSGGAASPLRKQLAHFSRLIAAVSIGIGLSFFAVGALIGVPLWQNVIFSIGIIVAMVPEGLLPTLTLSLVLAAQRMAQRNVLIRHLTSVETLGFATVICTDKTGTLTANHMQPRELWLGERGVPVPDLSGRPGLVRAHSGLFEAAALCHDLIESSRSGQVVMMGDPMEAALVEMARRFAPERSSRRIDEIPFDATRMRQSVVHESETGRFVFCKGALSSVLPLCRAVQFDGETRPLDDAVAEKIRNAEADMAGRGLRVLALASKNLSADGLTPAIEEGLTLEGLVGFADPPRPEVPEAICKCREAGVKVIMVTGDHPLTARSIAREIGLTRSQHARVVTGEEMDRLSEVALRIALDQDDVIFARVTPEQKMRVVAALIAKKHVVAVTGDGVNDAPALKAAHIGVAMGVAGTDVAKQAADMILTDDNFASIVAAIEEGRAVFQNIRKFLTYVLVHNVAELVPYLAFALFRIPLPLTPIQALFVDMGTDSLTALGLGVERPDPQNMRLPPRSHMERLLNAPLATRAYLFLGLIEAAVAMGAFFFVLMGAGWRYGETIAPTDTRYLAATTACLSAIIVLQIVNVYLCRSSVRSAFSTGLLDNKLIVWGVLLEASLLVLAAYSDLGHVLLGTATPPIELWLFLLPLAAAMLGLEEIRKWIVRRRLRSTSKLKGSLN